MEKTNVMRILDQKRIKYNFYSYNGEGLSGAQVASALGVDPQILFKTLVTVGKSKTNYVFVIPVEEELDLKKAAIISNEKSIEMIKSKELLSLTGYVHGGCSPIGMKKAFKTFIHASAKGKDLILFSAGKVGYQVELNPEDLLKLVNGRYVEL